MRRLSIPLAIALAALLLPAAAPAQPKEFFGVTPQTRPEREDLERMAAGNVGTLRYSIGWGVLDPGPADRDNPSDYEYLWPLLDPLIADAAESGVELFPNVYGTPYWVGNYEGCYSRCFNLGPSSPTAMVAWSRFLHELVDRYGRRGEFWRLHPELPYAPIRRWQIWNEPNLHGFWGPVPDVREYAQLLTVAAEAIRAEDPRAEIVLGGLLGSTPGGSLDVRAWGFLRRLYRQPGARESFDAVALHPYGAKLNGVKAQIRLIREEMRKAGDRRKPLWITEVGWASGRGKHPLDQGRKGQARLLERVFDLFLRKRREWRIAGVHWFAWRDTTPELATCEWCAKSGLFKRGRLVPKPAWRSFTRFTGGR